MLFSAMWILDPDGMSSFTYVGVRPVAVQTVVAILMGARGIEGEASAGDWDRGAEGVFVDARH